MRADESGRKRRNWSQRRTRGSPPCRLRSGSACIWRPFLGAAPCPRAGAVRPCCRRGSAHPPSLRAALNRMARAPDCAARATAHRSARDRTCRTPASGRHAASTTSWPYSATGPARGRSCRKQGRKRKGSLAAPALSGAGPAPLQPRAGPRLSCPDRGGESRLPKAETVCPRLSDLRACEALEGSPSPGSWARSRARTRPLRLQPGRLPGPPRGRRTWTGAIVLPGTDMGCDLARSWLGTRGLPAGATSGRGFRRTRWLGGPCRAIRFAGPSWPSQGAARCATARDRLLRPRDMLDACRPPTECRCRLSCRSARRSGAGPSPRRPPTSTGLQRTGR